MPFQTDIRLSRQKQIDTLRVFNENVTEMIPGKKYSINFKTLSLHLTLTIQLPENFPLEKPYMELSPPVYHQWVDPSGAVHSPGLRNFTEHSDLGMVVLALRRELEKTQLIPWNSDAAVSPPSATATATQSSFPSSQQPVDHISGSLGELSVEELKSILNDEDHFEAFLAQVEAKDQPLESLNESTAALRDELEAKAKENQQLQAQIESSRNSIICKYQDFHSKKSELQGSVNRLRDLDAKAQPDVLANRLLGLAVDCDEGSEQIAENFLNTQISIEEFIAKYIKSRAGGYLKKIKADKLKNPV